MLRDPALNKMKGNRYIWSSANVIPTTRKPLGRNAWLEARSVTNFESPDFKHLNISPFEKMIGFSAMWKLGKKN